MAASAYDYLKGTREGSSPGAEARTLEKSITFPDPKSIGIRRRTALKTCLARVHVCFRDFRVTKSAEVLTFKVKSPETPSPVREINAAIALETWRPHPGAPISSPVGSLVASGPVQNRNLGAGLRCGAFILDLRILGRRRRRGTGWQFWVLKRREVTKAGLGLGWVMVRSD